MPLVPLGFGLLYCILFLLNPDNLIQQLFKSAEMICFVFPAFMEGLILARLLPSNDSYAALWYACNLSCGLMDHNGVLNYVPEQQPQPSPAEIRAAAEQPILLNNGTLRLRSHPVSGGFGYWLKDISEINHINAQLAEKIDWQNRGAVSISRAPFMTASPRMSAPSWISSTSCSTHRLKQIPTWSK